jgi:hypothetical protein
VTVPPGIGLLNPVLVPVPDGSAFYETSMLVAAQMHTHTADGVIHIEDDEMPGPKTLGQFFDLWNVRFSATCVGAYCVGTNASSIAVTIDGRAIAGDPRAIDLEQAGLPGGIPGTIPLIAVEVQ